MKTAFRLLAGLVFLLVVQGCCCFGDAWHGNCALPTCDTLTACDVPVTGTPPPPHVTMH